jgi:hypothetical protein
LRKTLRLLPLRLPLILTVAVKPVFAVLSLFQLTPLLSFLALFAPIAHKQLLHSV